MRHGLIIGKFMPLHNGHIALIEFALQNCDQLTISVCARDSEPIPGETRYQWVKEVFGKHKNVTVDFIDMPLPDSPSSSRDVSQIWATFLKKRYPYTSILFSSQKYGDYLSQYMKIEHLPFDLERTKYPISGTIIREKPLHYWNMLPDCVKPYFVKRVCIYGAESTGKSILTKNLAEHFSTVYVPEMARNILGERHCLAEDIPVIARTQSKAVNKALPKANKLLFCDTDLITTQIYSIYYFSDVPKIVTELQHQERYNLYLLLNIDTPWIADSQRDCGHKRKFFHEWFKYELVLRNLPFVEVNGNWNERFSQAIKAVEQLTEKPCII